MESLAGNFKLIKVRSIFLLIFFSLTLVANSGYSQHEGIYDSRTNTLLEDQSPPPLSIFEDRSTLRVEIETDQKQLFSDLDREKKQKAVLTLYINDSIKIIKEIKIKVRGGTRKVLCDLPPLKIDLNETEFLSDWLGEIRSLKLVNTCNESARSGEDLHKEYIVYEMYQAVTDKSYQVRLIKMKIKDSLKENEDITGYAFVIENDKNLAYRTGLVETELDDINVREILNTFYLHPNEKTLYNMTVLSIFQYMIGNSDWHVTRLHNMKMFGNEEVKYAIPYDFDYSGFVNAEYAIPSSSLPIKKVTDRYYLGPCGDATIFEKALDTLLSKKDIFYLKIQCNPYLRNREKERLISYLDDFFKESSDKKTFINKLSGFNCQY